MSINVRAFLGVVVAACLGLWAGLPAAAQAPAAFSLTPHEQAGSSSIRCYGSAC
ncbi:hypothetical protein WJ978_29620 [Achromobacter xylosoxidans]